MKQNTYYPVLVAIIVALGGFLLGFDGVVNSGAITFYKNTFAIADQPFLLGLSTSAILLGSIFGNLSAGYISDRAGRKKALLTTAVLFMVGACGTALAPGIIIFIISKFIAGLGVGIALLTAPIYIAEFSPPKQRGKLVTVNQLNIVLGLSVAYFTNYYILQLVEDPDLNWRWMLGIGFFPALLYFLLLFFIPESPRWLIQKGKGGEGFDVLKKAGGEAYAAQESVKIKENIRSGSHKKKATLSEVFQPQMKIVLIIGFALAFFQQVSGINAVLYYAPMIFETAGGGRDAAFLQAVIVGVVFVVMTVVSMFLIDRLGRKPLLLIGTVTMAGFLLLVGISFHNASYQITSASVATIEKVLRDNTVMAEAKKSNPALYQKDSIVYKNNFAFLYRKGKIVGQVDMAAGQVISGQKEAGLLIEALVAFQGIKFDNELKYFQTLENEYARVHQARMTPGSNHKISRASIQRASSRFAASYKNLVRDSTISINAAWVLIGILGFIGGFSISLGPVMWTLFSEIFPNRLRGIAISVVGTLNALTSFTVATVFPVELAYLGSATTFFIFAGFMILCLIFVWKYVVETKGKTLEEIEAELIKI